MKTVYENDTGGKPINLLTAKNVRRAPDPGHNSMSTITLALKWFKVFLRKMSEGIKTAMKTKVHRLAEIVDRQYFLRIKTLETAIQANFVNSVPVLNTMKKRSKYGTTQRVAENITKDTKE